MNQSQCAGLALAGAERLVKLCALFVLIVFTLAPIAAQTPAPKEKEKSQPTGDPGKAKVQPKNPEPKPEPVKPTPPPEAFKLPPGTIGLVFDSVEKALKQLPEMVLLTPENYQALRTEIEAWKKKARPDRQSVSVCKLTGKLEDAYILLRAEMIVVTEKPQTIVPLGLQGAVPVDEGDLDPQNLSLEDGGEDGLVLRVNRPGTYRPVLNLRAKIDARRGGPMPTAGERGFTLTLPGAAVTTLSLNLPNHIKEILWNGVLEKPRSPGRWELAVGTTRQLDVSWKEPTVQPGSGPLLTADAKITVKLEETASRIDAEITLEDMRGQAQDWTLLVPDKAKVEMLKAPGGLQYDIRPQDPNKYLIRFAEPTAERFTVGVQMFVPRPAGGFIPKLPIGPFVVANAFSQRGTIVVQAKPSSLRGQRLIFQRFGEVTQREIPKGPDAAETAGIFTYSIPKGNSVLKAPLEIEWRAEKGLVETSVEHQLKLRRGANGLLIDTATQIKVKSLSAGVDFLDVQLPRFQVPHAGILSWFPPAGFPGGVAWSGLIESLPSDLSLAQPMTEFLCQEESGVASTEMSLPDGQGKARIKFLRPPPGKDFVLTIEGKYLVPGPSHRLRIELPRPLGILDRGGKVIVSGDDQIELLDGPATAEEPAPIGQSVAVPLDPLTNTAELAWRPYRPQYPAHSLVDVTLLGKHAHMRQQITVAARVGSGHVRLRVPESLLNLTVISGGTLMPRDKDVDKGFAWLNPDGKPLVVEFDQAMPRKEGEAVVWKVPLIWPADSLQLEAKVRVWSEPGVIPQPVDLADYWQDVGSDEPVDGHDSLPVLVLQGAGKELPLALRLPPAFSGQLPLFVCDRGLIQVVFDEAGNHNYRARYLIKKLNGNTFDVEFPVSFDDKSKLQISGVAANGKRLKINFAMERKIARLDLEPRIFRENMLLDIEYTVPANLVEGNAWQTQLSGPVLRGGDFLGRLRWSVSLPPGWVSIVASNNVRQDFRWSFQRGLLTPVPDMNSGDLEQWLTGKETPDNGAFLSQVFGRINQEPILIIHFAQSAWLLLCSGMLLTVGLVLYLAPLRRSVFWVIVVGLGLGLIGAGLIWPTWPPPLFLGIQPAVVVLLLLAAVEWFRHERYRRQVVFMPGFTRMKPGSSLLKPSGSAPRPREASTVDAPVGLVLPSLGSSAKGSKGEQE